MVNDIFKELILEKLFKAFIDDIGCGSGDALDPAIPDPTDEANPLAVAAFETHLNVLAYMFEGMISAGLKVKLSKCFFAQLVTACLGFLVGRGV